MSDVHKSRVGGLRSAVPDFTILELGITIACTRKPAPDHQQIADSIAEWFHHDISGANIELPLQRLLARGDMAQDDGHFCSTDTGRVRAEEAAQALVRLIFRDRFFFDVGKLLDVILVKEDSRAK